MDGTVLSSRAFTLVEVLAVLAIIALLLVTVLPTLERVRATAMDLNCRANLRTMQQGWAIYMSERDAVIPYTRTTSRHPNWWDAMDSVLDNAPIVWADKAGTFNACPTVQRSFPDTFYRTARWGYAINVWWANDTDPEKQLNEWKRWDAILQPSRYPWFVDPEVVPWGSGHLAAPYVPRMLSDFGPPNWGVGAHHQSGRHVNVSFADGGVRSVPLREIQAEMAGPNDFTWFTNR